MFFGLRYPLGNDLTAEFSTHIHSVLERINKSRGLRWAGHVVRMEENRTAFKTSTGKHTGNIPLGRCRRRWEDNIRLY